MWNLKKIVTNKFIYKTETYIQTWKTKLWLPKESREGINWGI